MFQVVPCFLLKKIFDSAATINHDSCCGVS
jgi:hypothetical protein